MLLADYVIVEHFADFARRRHSVLGLHEGDLVLFADDVHAQFYAFIADEHGWTGDELSHFVLALAAERAIEGALAVAARGFGHRSVSLSNGAMRVRAPTVTRASHSSTSCRICAASC